MNNKYRKTGLTVLLLLLALTLPLLIDSRYYLRLINVAFIYIIVVTGFNILYGLAGQLSFGHAGFFAIGAYAVGVTTVQYGLSPWIGFALAIVLSALAGVIVGVPTLRVKGHYLALATIAFGEIVRQILLNWEEVTRGYNGIIGIPSLKIGVWEFGNERSLYYFILLFVAVAIIVGERVKHSSYGRAMIAIKSSEVATEVMGVNSTQIKVLAFTLSAIYAGIAGALYAFVFGYISPDAFEFHVSVTIVAMLLVGGAGSTVGAALGATLLTMLPEVLRVGERYYMLIYGFIFLAILVFLPGGIVSLYGKVTNKIGRTPQPPKTSEPQPEQVRASVVQHESSEIA